jgi:uncharacterized protein (TIGR03083 family)
MIAAERTELLEFLRTLSADDWLAPSLCEGWRVRDVVAHLLWDNVSIGRYLWVSARYRLPDRVNQLYVDQAQDLPTSALLTGLASTIGGGWISRTIPAGVLADLVVHHQDIRRPLGRQRTIEPARLLHALQKPNRFAHPRRITKGLKLTATDLDWTVGAGPEVRGCGEALALAIVGRKSVVDELNGDGVAILARRISN